MIIEAPELLADSLRLLHPSVPLGFWSHSKRLPLLPTPPSLTHRHVWAAGPAAELYSPVGRRRAGSRELAEGNTADHISSARAKYYSDIAFQTDTNCSSNKHRRANPWAFIGVGKDERKGQSQGAFESWPGVAGPRPLCTPGVFSGEGLKPSTRALGFAFIVTHKACVGTYTSCSERRGGNLHGPGCLCGPTGLTSRCQSGPGDSWLQRRHSFPHRASVPWSICVCLFAEFSGDIPPGLGSLTSG